MVQMKLCLRVPPTIALSLYIPHGSDETFARSENESSDSEPLYPTWFR